MLQRKPRNRLAASLLAIPLLLVGAPLVLGAGSGDHAHGQGSGDAHAEQDEALKKMMDMHAGHDHAHNFEAMSDVDKESMNRTMDMMMELGLAVPPMDSENGRDLFLKKGCVVCHSVNGVGGKVGPSLNADDMPHPMNTFEFAARMWRGAPAMIKMQQQLFGEKINLTGKELADIIAFAHDEQAQRKLGAEQIPERFQELVIN